MKEAYSFSKGERGNFYQPDAQFQLPVYLDAQVLKYLQERAEARGISVSELANDILRRDIELVEAFK